MTPRKKVVLPAPLPQDVLGEAVYNYPDGYMYPFTVLVREAFVKYRLEFEAGAEFKIPQYGTLTTKGRGFTLVLEPAYRAKKNYPAEISGTWGV